MPARGSRASRTSAPASIEGPAELPRVDVALLGEDARDAAADGAGAEEGDA